MENKPQFRYNRIRPTRSVTGTGNFNGEIQFEWASTSNVRVDLQNAYLEFRGTLNNATANWVLGAAPDATTNLFSQARIGNNGICQNPFTTMFKSATLFVNDKEVSRSHQFSGESSHLKMTLNNNEEKISDCSPFIPIKYNNGTTYNAAASYINSSCIVKNNVLGVINDQNLATVKILEKVYPELDSNLIAAPTPADLVLKMAHPLAPLFIQENPDEALYASKIRLSLQVDPDHLKKLCIATTDDPTLTLTVTDFQLNIPTYESVIGPPIGINYSTRYMESHSTVRAMSTSTDNFQVSLPSASIKYVLMSFGTTGVGALIDSNLYDRAFTSAATNITSLYINFANRSYPSPQYSFPQDYLRAFEDYLHFSSAKMMGNAPPMSFSQWLQTPVFVFIVLPEPGNQANILDVHVTATDALTSRQIILTAWYDKELSIEYGESGQVVDTSVKFLNE